MVMVAPGAAVPPLGFWLITWLYRGGRGGVGLDVDLEALACKVALGLGSAGWPTTLGTATGACPLETNSVTRVFAGTVVPFGRAGVDDRVRLDAARNSGRPASTQVLGLRSALLRRGHGLARSPAAPRTVLPALKHSR